MKLKCAVCAIKVYLCGILLSRVVMSFQTLSIYRILVMNWSADNGKYKISS